MGTCSCQCHSPWASVIPPCCICECKNKLNPSMGSYWMPDNSIEDRINHTQDGIEKCFNRIEKIEGDMNHVPSFDYINEHIAILTKRIDDLQINQTITKCENAYKIDSLKLRSIYSRLDEIFYEFHNLREIVESESKEIFERIDKLESHYYSDGDLSAIHGQIDNVNKNMKYFEHDAKRLEERINELESFKHLRFSVYETKPHKCPVCEGNRDIRVAPSPLINLAVNNYRIDAIGNYYTSCSVCEGKGILWG